jgi:hypothetical protein
MKWVLIVLAVLVVAIGGAFAFARITEPEMHPLDVLWKSVAGPADMGAVDFDAITRSATGNDALACPTGACAEAGVDRVSGIYAFSPAELGSAVGRILAETEDTERTFISDDGLEQRFVVRTPVMRWPDTVAIRLVALPEGGSTLYVFSRSKLGRSDFGVNLARLERVMTRLRELSDQAVAGRAVDRPSAAAPPAPDTPPPTDSAEGPDGPASEATQR